jgi:hypothetical protein
VTKPAGNGSSLKFHADPIHVRSFEADDNTQGCSRKKTEDIRAWLEYQPEKVLFATDAFLFSPEVGWEEVGWLSSKTGREALAIALTGMMRDGQITRARGRLSLARMVMRENAAGLDGIK